MKRLSTPEANDLNYFALCVKFEQTNEQNFLYWFPQHKDMHDLTLSRISTPKSLLALTVFNGSSLYTLVMSDNKIIKGRKELKDGSFELAIDELSEAFVRLPNLTSLDVSDNGFAEHSCSLILSMSHKIKILNFSKNDIGEHGEAVTKTLTVLTNLEQLDLSDNNLNISALKAIQTYPKALPKLKSLDIRKNFDNETTQFLETVKVFKDHNDTVNEPLFKSFCEFLIVHPEVDPNAISDIVGDHHDHTITLYHD